MKITLEKMLESLSHDTLAFMADSNLANGTIAPDQIPKVTSRLNSVIRRLAVKFVLNEKFVYVTVTANRRYYTMKADDTWIVSDPDEPFTGDVARILGIETPTGRMHNLGDKAVHNSILLRDEGQSFGLDSLLPSGVYKVIYKAATPQFKLDGSDLKQELNIPESLLNALYMGVAAITYEGIGGAENLAMARDKWAHYEKECKEAQLNSTVDVEENDEGNKFKDKGYH